MNVIEILKNRGFIENTTHDAELDDIANSGRLSCYVGFDPTASSLHVGHLIPIMALAHMQRQGHRPIALVGGGTGLIGDPSGKTEMRQILTIEEVQKNAECIKNQLSRFIDFSDEKAVCTNNADWLTRLNYISFLRDIGCHFSVNRMIKAESYKSRIDSEEGLNFIEFNYMILQAYDFLYLFDHYDCKLQMGGNDQWGNIVAGIDLIRKMRQKTACGLTFPLITTSTGAKMGKTAKGAVWIDPARTSPYEYFQFWINTDDRDVIKFLLLFTFLPFNEIKDAEKLTGQELNNAKAILAYEATSLVHGREESNQAYVAASEIFGARQIPDDLLPSSSILRTIDGIEDATIPLTEIPEGQFENGLPAFKCFSMTDLADTGASAKRLIEQGGAYINGKRIENINQLITSKDFINGELLLRAGKKRYHKIILIN